MGRGPSYPYVDLEAGIALAQKTYDYTKRAPAQLDSVVSEAWKYSKASSSGQKVLAALKAYGLIEDAPGSNGKAIKLTQRAIRILLDDTNSGERHEEIVKAALAPKWYDFCWRTWGKEMPASMRSNLLIEHGFVDSTVEGFLKDYKRTIAFAGLLNDTYFSNSDDGTPDSSPDPQPGDYVQWESRGVLRMENAKRLVKFSDDGKFAFVEGSFTGIPVGELIKADAPIEEPKSPEKSFPPLKTSPREDNAMQVDTLSLADGITLQFQWPKTITQDAYDDFLYQLEGFKRRVGRAVQKENPSTDNVVMHSPGEESEAGG